jgi:hypothetical protein
MLRGRGGAVAVAEPVQTFGAGGVVGAGEDGHTLSVQLLGQFLDPLGVGPFVAELLRGMVETAVPGGLHQHLDRLRTVIEVGDDRGLGQVEEVVLTRHGAGQVRPGDGQRGVDLLAGGLGPLGDLRRRHAEQGQLFNGVELVTGAVNYS